MPLWNINTVLEAEESSSRAGRTADFIRGTVVQQSRQVNADYERSFWAHKAGIPTKAGRSSRHPSGLPKL